MAISFAESWEEKTKEAKKMGYLKYVKQAFRKPSKEAKEVQNQRVIGFRKEPVTIRIERPTRLDKARALGYKPKRGVIIVRQRLVRGGHTRPDISGGRRPSRSHTRLTLGKNYQQMAEERVAKKFKNCEVLGSYHVAKDGKNYWFEIVLIDRTAPEVLADKNLQGIALQKGRSYRGVTSAGRKGRGLRKKGIGTEKLRPSKRANDRRH